MSFSFYSSVDRTRQREIAFSNDSNDLMVNKFKLTVVHVAHLNPMQIDLCMCVELPLDKNLWKIRTGPRATTTLGCWAVGRWPAFSKTRVGGVWGFQMTGA